MTTHRCNKNFESLKIEFFLLKEIKKTSHSRCFAGVFSCCQKSPNRERAIEYGQLSTSLRGDADPCVFPYAIVLAVPTAGSAFHLAFHTSRNLDGTLERFESGSEYLECS